MANYTAQSMVYEKSIRDTRLYSKEILCSLTFYISSCSCTVESFFASNSLFAIKDQLCSVLLMLRVRFRFLNL